MAMELEIPMGGEKKSQSIRYQEKLAAAIHIHVPNRVYSLIRDGTIFIQLEPLFIY